jgi:plasmid stabilization system protein ParE
MALATVEAARRAVERPMTGHMRPEVRPAPYRFRAVRGFPYLLVYDSRQASVKILRVLRMARDMAPLLADLQNSSDPPEA